MPVFPNQRRTQPSGLMAAATTATPTTFVDTPIMDYVAWLQQCTQSIATFDGDPSAYSVAVVGAGAAGLAAAYELLRCGVDVTVFEAGARAGGRLYTLDSAGSPGNRFEMGAMRFTPSEQVLHYYAGVLNDGGADIRFGTGAFPDPLSEDETFISFKGQTYVYTPGGDNTMPPNYDRVNDGWHAFVANGFTSADGSISLVAPNTITGWLADPQNHESDIVRAWQAYIDAFGNSSLYAAVVRIFTDANAPAPDMSLPPGDRVWSNTDFEFLGALGTGIGGFGPLFPIGFLDIMRFTINAVETDQVELLTGTSSIVDGFLNQKITLPNGGTTTVGDRVVKNAAATAIVPEQGRVSVTVAGQPPRLFDRVVVATSHRAMELSMGLGTSASGLAQPVADAVRRVHLENSSKVFVETRAFWDDPQPGTTHNWPRNVVGDTILRNLYTLTYPDAEPGTGVLLFSYTWADDSVKQQTFTDPQDRLDLLLRDLATISPELAQKVADSIDRTSVQVIDWQSVPHYFGAFKLNQPGQDPYVQDLFYDFQKAGTGDDTHVYLAGDSVGFLGGWVENALQTGVNAAAGVAVSLGATLNANDAGPFTCLQPETYRYVAPAPQPAPIPAAEMIPA